MENQNQEKLDELIAKLKAFGQKVKSTRDGFGSPVTDRVATRLDKLLTRLPQHDGGSNPRQPQQPQESTLVCPRCGVLAPPASHFCSRCGFDFEEEQRQQAKAAFEREKIERAGRVGVLF
jgi:ribosomal protein L37E